MSSLLRRRKTRPPRPMTTHSSFAESAHDGGGWHERSGARQYDAFDMSSFSTEPGPPLPGGPRPRRGGAARRIVATFVLLLAVALLAAIVAVVVGWKSGSDVTPGRDVRVTIPKGATAAEVARVLADAEVVRNKTVFQARLRLNGDGAQFRSGNYRMKTLSAYDTIVKTLEKGPPAAPTFHVLFPEGFRITEMAGKIDRLRSDAEQEGTEPLPRFSGEEYLAAVKRATLPVQFQAPKGTTSIEGFLFPATYELKLAATADDLVQKQLAAMVDAMGSLDLTYARSKQLTPYDVVNIAAMVEREARVAKERPLVAAVIYNRLREGMTLGIDATIQYAVSDEGWKTELTQSDLEIDSPYNTRTTGGLPPTPIANPGLASLQAAARPAKDEDVLFYVAKPDGSGEHFFTDSYDEFLNFQNQ